MSKPDRYLYVAYDEDYGYEGLIHFFLSFSDPVVGTRFHSFLRSLVNREDYQAIDTILSQLHLHPDFRDFSFDSNLVLTEEEQNLITSVGPECIESAFFECDPGASFGGIVDGFAYKSHEDDLY